MCYKSTWFEFLRVSSIYKFVNLTPNARQRGRKLCVLRAVVRMPVDIGALVVGRRHLARPIVHCDQGERKKNRRHSIPTSNPADSDRARAVGITESHTGAESYQIIILTLMLSIGFFVIILTANTKQTAYAAGTSRLSRRSLGC